MVSKTIVQGDSDHSMFLSHETPQPDIKQDTKPDYFIAVS